MSLALLCFGPGCHLATIWTGLGLVVLHVELVTALPALHLYLGHLSIPPLTRLALAASDNQVIILFSETLESQIASDLFCSSRTHLAISLALFCASSIWAWNDALVI